VVRSSREPRNPQFVPVLRTLRYIRQRAPTRVVIGAVRLATALAAIVIVTRVWRVMAVLPWQIDGMIAAAAVLLWAYWFERGDDVQ
jgi:hypothetical protein